MNKETKKRLLALALAGTMTANMSGCYSESNVKKSSYDNNITTNEESKEEKVDNTTDSSMSNVSEIGYTDNVTTSEETKKEKVYNTAEYSLVYISGNIYLTTKSEDYDKHCWNYYDALTGDYVGSELIPVEDLSRVFEEVEAVQVLTPFLPYTMSAYYYYFNDKSINNGQYGYGKTLPLASIFPLSLFVKSKAFGMKEFEYFTSNSEKLKKQIFDTKTPVLLKYADHSYIDRDKDGYLDYKDYMTSQKLQKVICTKKDGEKLTLFGYRCSYYKNDMGYEEFYDFLTGNIYYIGKNREDTFASVKIYNYDNKDEKNLSLLQREANRTSNKLYTNQNIVMLDTTVKSEYLAHGNREEIQKYYFLIYDHKDIIEDETFSVYKDLFNEGATADASNNLSGINYYGDNYIISSINTFERTDKTYQATIISNLKYILNSMGYSDMIKNEYTLEELAAINEIINTKELTKKLS